jgi:NADH:ubiquinone oxidoreductase subunit C
MSDESVTSVRLQQKFGAAILAQHTAHGDDTLVVKREAWREVMRFLRDDPDLRYNFLMDLTAVDYLTMGRAALGVVASPIPCRITSACASRRLSLMTTHALTR